MADAIDLDNYSGSESESTNNNSDTDNNSKDSESGALSPASAARVEELTRELNAIRMGNGKERARPSGLHLFTGSGLHYFHSLTSVRPSSADNHIIPPTSSRFSHSGTGAIGDPPLLLPIRHHLGWAWQSGQVSGGLPKISTSARLFGRNAARPVISRNWPSIARPGMRPSNIGILCASPRPV